MFFTLYSSVWKNAKLVLLLMMITVISIDVRNSVTIKWSGRPTTHHYPHSHHPSYSTQELSVRLLIPSDIASKLTTKDQVVFGMAQFAGHDSLQCIKSISTPWVKKHWTVMHNWNKYIQYAALKIGSWQAIAILIIFTFLVTTDDKCNYSFLKEEFMRMMHDFSVY